MRVRRFAALIATAVVVVGLYAAYDPAAVGALWPAAGPLATRLHAFLPTRSGAGAGAVAAPTAAAASRPPVVVVVGHAARKDLPWKLDEIGTAQAIASVALRPHFDATVDKVLVADGAPVKVGETLIELDARQVRAQIDGAKAQLAKDQAALDQAQRDVTRYADLVARAATPQLNLDNARTAEATARAAILGDQAAIENLEVQLGWYAVTAPISGRVGVVSIKQGNIAKASDNSASGVFATINQISPIYVAFSVQQSLLPALHVAMAGGATVEATPQGSKRRVADCAGRRPLGVAIVGGLCVSQLLTLYITPVVYYYLDKIDSALAGRRQTARARRGKIRAVRCGGRVRRRVGAGVAGPATKALPF